MFSEETRKRYPQSHKCVPADDPFLSHLPSIRRSCSPPLIRFIIIISLLSRPYPTPPMPQPPPYPNPLPPNAIPRRCTWWADASIAGPLWHRAKGININLIPVCVRRKRCLSERVHIHRQTDRQRDSYMYIHNWILGEGDRTCICVFVYVYR